MRRPEELQDKIYRALNTAARAVGVETHAYRPSGPAHPLHPGNRFLRLRAAFSGGEGRFTQPSTYGEPLWHGLFDAAYTQPGDYLVQGKSVWFIAAQQRLQPVLCVLTNRVVSFSRPAAPMVTGVNDYGGMIPATNSSLLIDWPASVLGAASRGHPETNLPADTAVPYWNVLLPALPGIVLLPADLMSDDIGRNAVIAAAELTDLGWRITARQATT
jgi:hypothetical protein